MHSSLPRSTRLSAPLLRSLVVASLMPVAVASAEPATDTEPASEAAEKIEQYKREFSDVEKAEARAALAELDAEIERLEARVAQAPDPEAAREAQARLAALEERQDALRSEFNRARFDELKADVRREWNNFKSWVSNIGDRDDASTASQTSTAAEPGPTDREVDHPRDTGNYVRSPEAAGAPVAVNRESLYEEEKDKASVPSDVAAARQELSLSRVDLELDLLRDRAEKLAGAPREQVQQRIGAFEERRDALASSFSEDRYEQLVDDIQAEIQQARSAAE